MLKQTSLKDIRVRILGVAQQPSDHRVLVRASDVIEDASFIFPFFDALLDVRFLLIIIKSRHFLLYEEPVWERRILVASKRRLVSLNESQPDLFQRYFHFDPWWAMRDATTVIPAVRQAVIASNVAARQHRHLIIREVVFRHNLEKVEEVRVSDGVFRAVTYNQARPMPWAMHEAFFSQHDIRRPAGE